MEESIGNMKKNNKKNNKGSSTLEILIAFAVMTLSMSAVVFLIFGSQSISIDTQTNNEAIYKATKLIEDARVLSRQNFSALNSITTSETSGGITYNLKLTVNDLSQCLKQATSTSSWIGNGKQQKIELGTLLADGATAFALGGDCIDGIPMSDWTRPTRFASDTMSPGKPMSMDELNRYVYLGSDKTPFLYIANTNGVVFGQNSGIFVPFTNSFSAGNTINSLDAVKYSSTGKTYVFAALDNTTKQLSVIDVTNPTQPAASLYGLSSCVKGTAPQGHLVYFYKNTLYLTTLYTAGPEFHIFDVSNPASPTEYEIGSASCKGYELGDSVNDIVVKDQFVGGVTKRFAYMATDELDKELRVFDVTNPLAIVEVTVANKDLPGAQNGMSVFSVGNKLFFGRQSTTGGDELYVFDISNPYSGLPQLGSADIGTGVNAIRVAGKFAFIATPKTNQEFQVWDISNLSNITNVSVYNFGNIVNRGIDYDPDFIYSTGQSTPNFQIIYSP